MPKLTDYKWTEPTQCLLVNVKSLEMLENIGSRFLCATTDDCYELLFDCVRIEEDEEARAELRRLLEVPPDTELPTEGYIVFWR